MIQQAAVFPQLALTLDGLITGAKSTFRDANNAVLLGAIGPNGGEITELLALPLQTVTATPLFLFTSRDWGTTLILRRTKLMAAHAFDPATPPPATDFGFTDSLVLRVEGQGGKIPAIPCTTAIGTSGALTVARAPGVTADPSKAAGTVIEFYAGLSCGAGATLNFEGTGDQQMVRDDTGAAVSAEDVVKGGYHMARSDGTRWRILAHTRVYGGAGVAANAGGIQMSGVGRNY